MNNSLEQKGERPTPAENGVKCFECGGSHEPSGARTDCINHWKRRAVAAENEVNVLKNYNDSYWKKIAFHRAEKIVELESVITKGINPL